MDSRCGETASGRRRVGRWVLACGVSVIGAGCSGPPSPTVITPLPATPSKNAGADPVEAEPFDADDQVTKLRELRDKGLISEDEFQARKARLLKSGSR